MIENDEVHIRTYERGVEDETLSCGTGVTAAAIASVYAGLLKKSDQAIKVYTRGGILQVQFEMNNTEFVNVRLIGPAIKSFEGEIEL